MSEITPNTPNPVREDAYKQQLAAKLGIDPQYIPGSPIWHSEEEIAAIAEMFANMSGGGSSGGGALVVELDNDGNLDITAGDLFSAAQSGYVVVKGASEQLGNIVLPVVAATNNVDGYTFAVGFCDGSTFTTWLYHAALSTQKPSYYEP